MGVEKKKKKKKKKKKGTLPALGVCKMTRNDMYYVVESAYLHPCTCVNMSRALIYIGKDNICALGYKNNLIAVYWNNTVYALVRLSRASEKYVCKFARLMDAPLVYLYRRHGISDEEYERNFWNDWEEVIDASMNK